MADKFTGNIGQMVRLWGLYARMDAQWFLRDTKYCIINIITDLISTFATVSGVFLLSERFGGISGMDRNQILFMLGYAAMIDGIFLLFFNMCNVAHISRRIGRGQVDHMLVQPLPLWMQLATEGFIPVSGSSMFICGLGIMAYTAAQLHLAVTPIWLLTLSINLVSSTAIIIAISYLTGSMAFYAPVAGEEVSSISIGMFHSLKSFPLGGLSGLAQTALCTILPIGLTAWLPSRAMLGQIPMEKPTFLMILSALLFSAAALQVFKKGLKYYAKSGSNRYHDRGHRR